MTDNTKTIPDQKRKAFSQFNDGYLMEARNTCDEILSEDSSDPEILCLLGVIYGQLNQFSEAIQYLRDAIECSPDFIDAHYNLAIALRHLGENREAGEELDYVVERRPGDVNAHYTLGLIKMALGEYQQAIECHQTAQRLEPGNMQAIAGEAEVYEKQGEIDRASEIIQPYVSGGISNEFIALIYGKLAARTGITSEVIQQIKQCVDSNGIDPAGRVQLHFLLGSLCDKSGVYDEAFQHYEEGNALKGVFFDSYRYQFELDQIIERFSSVNLDNLPRSSCRSSLPIFIVGMPRSGTSLVEQILDSHRSIHGAGELEDIGNIVNELSIGKRIGSYEMDFSAVLTTQRLDKAANTYLGRLQSLSSSALRITDKMPGNFRYLGYIALMFPTARVIHCRRNAIDTCLSCFFQNFSSAYDYAFGLEDLGRYYLGYRKLMDHWQEVLPLQVHEVEYSKLVADPEAEIRELVNFCGLDWDEQCLKHHENSRITRTASYNQVRAPIYTKSINRWHHYKKHIGALTSILGDEI